MLYVRKIFEKTTISPPPPPPPPPPPHPPPLISPRTCAHQGVRNVSFTENFAYVLNE